MTCPEQPGDFTQQEKEAIGVLFNMTHEDRLAELEEIIDSASQRNSKKKPKPEKPQSAS